MLESPFNIFARFKPVNLLKGEYCKIFKDTIMLKICEQLLLQFQLLTVNISFWVLAFALIQSAFVKGPLPVLLRVLSIGSSFI